MINGTEERSKAEVMHRKRLRRAQARAKKVFGTAEAAKAWLKSECPALGFARPVDLLDDDNGLENVTAILVRIDHGVFS